MMSCLDSSGLGRFGGLLVLALTVVGCGRAFVESQAAAPNSPAASFEEGAWGRYESARFGFSIGLPDGRAWKIDDHESSWLTAMHAASGSQLRMRSWNEPRPVSRESCLGRARALSPTVIPEVSAMVILDDRIETMGGDDASARIQVAATQDGDGELRGIVLLSGVSIRRCFTMALETRANGPGAEKLIAERLAVVTESIVPSIQFTKMVDVPRSSLTEERSAF